VRRVLHARCVLAAAATIAALPARLLTGGVTGVPASAWQQRARPAAECGGESVVLVYAEM
jgi:hypothetical protein